MVFWRKISWRSGYKVGKKEYNKQLKSLQNQNKRLKGELTKMETSSRKERDKIVREEAKQKKKLVTQSDRKLRSVYKRMDYRVSKANAAITDSERLLKKLKTFETWVVTQFHKSIQAQTAFVNGLSGKIEDFMIEQERIKNELTRIAQEKKLFQDNRKRNLAAKKNIKTLKA